MACMNSQDAEEQEIIRSWHSNAAPWARAIRAASIASRKLVTDQAIIDAVSSVPSRRILDVGCGEGWLARAPPRATASGTVAFHVQDYTSIANRAWRAGPFDAAVCRHGHTGIRNLDRQVAAHGADLTQMELE